MSQSPSNSFERQKSNSPILRCVFVIDGTSNLSPHFDTIKKDYIDLLIPLFFQPKPVKINGEHTKISPIVEFSSVTYYDHSSLVASPAVKRSSTTNSRAFKQDLAGISFIEGGSKYAAVLEGLTSALEILDSNSTPDVSSESNNDIRHCILVGNSLPYHEVLNAGYDQEPALRNLESICKAFKDLHVNFSVITPNIKIRLFHEIVVKFNQTETEIFDYKRTDSKPYMVRIAGISPPNKYKLPEGISISRFVFKRPIGGYEPVIDLNTPKSSATPLQLQSKMEPVSASPTLAETATLAIKDQISQHNHTDPPHTNLLADDKSLSNCSVLKIESSEFLHESVQPKPITSRKNSRTSKQPNAPSSDKLNSPESNQLGEAPRTPITNPVTPSLLQYNEEVSDERQNLSKATRGAKRPAVPRKASKAKINPKIPTPVPVESFSTGAQSSKGSAELVTNQVPELQLSVSNTFIPTIGDSHALPLSNESKLTPSTSSNFIQPPNSNTIHLSGPPSHSPNNAAFTSPSVNSGNHSSPFQNGQAQGQPGSNVGAFNTVTNIRGPSQSISLSNTPTIIPNQGFNITNPTLVPNQIPSAMSGTPQQIPLQGQGFTNSGLSQNIPIPIRPPMASTNMSQPQESRQISLQGQTNVQGLLAQNQINQQNLNRTQNQAVSNQIQKPPQSMVSQSPANSQVYNFQGQPGSQAMLMQAQIANSMNGGMGNSNPSINMNNKPTMSPIWRGQFGFVLTNPAGQQQESLCNVFAAGVNTNTEKFALDRWPQKIMINQIVLCNVESIVEFSNRNGGGIFLLSGIQSDGMIPQPLMVMMNRLIEKTSVAISEIINPQTKEKRGFLFFKGTNRIMGISFFNTPLPDINNFPLPGSASSQLNVNQQAMTQNITPNLNFQAMANATQVRAQALMNQRAAQMALQAQATNVNPQMNPLTHMNQGFLLNQGFQFQNGQQLNPEALRRAQQAAMMQQTQLNPQQLQNSMLQMQMQAQFNQMNRPQ